MPPKSDFPGTGPTGNGISTNIKSQGEWIRNVVNTDGCTGCHQMGNKATREIPKALGTFENSSAAWERRVQSGQAGAGMLARFTQAGKARAPAMWGDWTDRIAAGALPATAPPRPQGRERNVVITMWDWADPKTYLHDEIASDKRNPTVNANGPVYGATEEAADYMPVVLPKTNGTEQVPLQVRDPKTPRPGPPTQPSAYWGDESIWTAQSTAHSFAMDGKSRVWVAARIRPNQTAEFCRKGSSHTSAQVFPIEQSGRQMQMFDPKTKKVTTIDTCFGTHHLNFDNNDVLWYTGGGPVEGFFDTASTTRPATRRRPRAGRRSSSTTTATASATRIPSRISRPIPPRTDAWSRRSTAWRRARLTTRCGVRCSACPVRWCGWCPDPNPANTALTEVYEVPWNNPKASAQGFAPRGMDVDSNGVVWTVLSSGHTASFDRRKCKGPLTGPTATGQHCPEGWTLYPLPGPNYEGAVESGSADSAYYNFVDRFDMLGVGKDINLVTGNLSEGLLAVVDGKFLTFRMPYPMGFYAKGLDGRIDDPKAGWKGKGIWTSISTRAPFHMEGGRGTSSKVVKFQVRPDPLAR